MIFPSGQKVNASEATPDELTAFFTDVVNVINQNAKPWSIYIRWHALNVGINAGRLRMFSPLDSPEEIHIEKVSEAKASGDEVKTEEKASESGETEEV